MPVASDDEETAMHSLPVKVLLKAMMLITQRPAILSYNTMGSAKLGLVAPWPQRPDMPVKRLPIVFDRTVAPVDLLMTR